MTTSHQEHRALSIFMHPRCFWVLRLSGVARYVCELTRELLDMGHNVHIPIKDTPTEYLLRADYYEQLAAETPKLPWHIKAFYKLGQRTPRADHFLRFIRRWEGARAMDEIEFDLVHPTHMNSLEILDHLHGKPLVVTVHDMTHELRPESFPAHDPSAQRKKIMVERATRVIAISQQTKDDLVRLHGTDPDKIDVIHHGNSLKLPPQHEQMQLELPERYVFFVGARQGYKNFARTLQAIAPLMEKDAQLHLVCAGGGAFRPDESALMDSLGISSRVKQMWVSDDELAVMYHRARCFIYPSEYEGFGLPILEAYECGAPVLCAHASCFPEVAGDAALFFDPTDVSDITQKLERLCYDESQRADYLARGRARIQQFSWRRCAEETFACYNKALESSFQTPISR